ncbi:MAG: DUF1573 domain-containing protein [Planctomycetes bacterium]|nr:DUF1573 domain-containing protein [Planctomycetia bacterium]MBI3463768.1 DUF1573 domain-containing protein [Planctomycetota bacterium]
MRVLLACLLLVAAALKLHGLMVGASARDSLLSSPAAQFAVAEIEILLALWLISGRSERLLWWAATGFFGIVAGVSLYSALLGRTSCGCFGAVRVSPWATFAADSIALALLVLARPRAAGVGNTSASIPSILKVVAGTLACAVVVAAVWTAAFWGDPVGGLLRVRGEPVTLNPSTVSVGTAEVGDSRTFTVFVTNRGEQPIRVTGIGSCSCSVGSQLPLTVPAGESRRIDISVMFPDRPGDFAGRVPFFADLRTEPIVFWAFYGRANDSRNGKV